MYIIIILLIILLLNNYKRQTISNMANINWSSPIQKYFDKIYVITLPQRKEYIENIMKNINLNPIYFSAKLKNELDYNKLINDNIVKRQFVKKKNYGRIACHYSHISVLQNFLDSNAETCLIFEDDIRPIENVTHLNDTFKNNISELPDDWDILYLGRCWDNCKKQTKISLNIYKLYTPKCRHAYAVTKKGAEIILKYSIPQYIAGDKIYAELIKNNKLQAYGFSPQLFLQNRENLGSTLGNINVLKECSSSSKLF
jgi:GR25 family glycosyltransferase involved in LPS biosynthesis